MDWKAARLLYLMIWSLYDSLKDTKSIKSIRELKNLIGKNTIWISIGPDDSNVSITTALNGAKPTLDLLDDTD